jgi:hypothetical protein
VLPGAGTLQTALDGANAGDTLILADGTYTAYTWRANDTAVLMISKSVTIHALNVGRAVLDGQHLRRVVHITSGTVNLEGLDITRGLAVCANTTDPDTVSLSL